MYVNDLATGIKDLNCGVDINERNVSILLYADDIVLISEDEHSLQKIIQFTVMFHDMICLRRGRKKWQ